MNNGDEKERLCALLDEHLEGLLDKDQKVLFAAHLEECGACQSLEEADGLVSAAMRLSFYEPLSEVAELRIRRALSRQIALEETAPEILDLEGAAELLCISLSELSELLEKLPYFEVGGRLRFGREALLRWAAEQAQLRWRERSVRELRTSRKLLVFPGGK